MKLIDLTPLPDCPANDTPALVLKAVATFPQEGANLAAIRKRLRILDALEAAGDALELPLEDADHHELVQAVEAFRFPIASKHAVHACDAVLSAKAPAKIEET